MSELFDRLFGLISEVLHALTFWHILNADECGIVLRLGSYHRDLKLGLNWKWPVVDATRVTSAALDSTNLREQTLTTLDGHQVTLRGIMTYRVSDARKYILEVENAESVVNDVGSCVVADVVPTMTLEDVLKDEVFAKELRKMMRTRAKRWGVEVESFGLADRVQTRVYRIITGGAALLATLLCLGCAGRGEAADDPYYHRCHGGASVGRTTYARRTTDDWQVDSYETTVWAECGL